MEAACSSETLVDFQRTILRYNPEDITVHNQRPENLRFYKLLHEIESGLTSWQLII
jgi:hypothetical protein